MSRFDDQIARRRLIKNLRKDPQDLLARAVANLLASCDTETPCHSGACVLCGRNLQRAGTNLALRTSPATRGRRTAVTLIPMAGRVAPDSLDVGVFERVLQGAESALQTCGIEPCVSMLDVSFNEDETGKVPDHWQVHHHGVLLDWPSRAQHDALHMHYPASSHIRRPVHMELLDDNERGILYALKPDRVRRVSYIDSSKPEREPFRNSRRRNLRPWQAVALAKVEHEFGLRRRLLTHGIDLDVVKRALEGFD